MTYDYVTNILKRDYSCGIGNSRINWGGKQNLRDMNIYILSSPCKFILLVGTDWFYKIQLDIKSGEKLSLLL